MFKSVLGIPIFQLYHVLRFRIISFVKLFEHAYDMSTQGMLGVTLDSRSHIYIKGIVKGIIGFKIMYWSM